MSGVEGESADSWSSRKSGIDAAGLKGGRYAIDSQHVRSHPVTHIVLLRKIDDIPEAVDHDLFQAAIDELFVPEEALPVLHPFKVGNGDAAGVSQYVGDHKNFLLGQDGIRLRGRWTVGAFADDLSFNAVCIRRRDDILLGRRQQNVTVQKQ